MKLSPLKENGKSSRDKSSSRIGIESPPSSAYIKPDTRNFKVGKNIIFKDVGFAKYVKSKIKDYYDFKIKSESENAIPILNAKE